MFVTTGPDGNFVTLPIDFKFARRVRGRLTNDIHLKIDERDFDHCFGRHAIWVAGEGSYATLAYCGGELTIQRHSTIEKAVEAKRIIDGGGCGGGCAKAHLIVYCDPENREHEAEQKRIREYLETQKTAGGEQ